MSHVVVLGAGLGGVAAAYDIKAALGRTHRVTVVADGAYFNFTPSNPWVAVGWRKPEQIRVALERRESEVVRAFRDRKDGGGG